jgi:sugar phosphate isomerase/epimerase
MKMNIGLQLHTIRDELHRGYDEVFKQVAEIGYAGVEVGYDPALGEKLSRILHKHSLQAIAVHMSPGNIENDYENVKSFMKQVNSEIMITGFGEGDLDTIEKAVSCAKRLDGLAEKIANDGYVLGCHNHWWEFTERFGGKTVTDIFCENSELFKFEMDIGWAFVGRADVVKYINKLGSRIILLHIKDATADYKLTEVGSGAIDMKEALDVACAAGVKWGIVEQDDNFKFSPFDSAKASYEYLQTIL